MARQMVTLSLFPPPQIWDGKRSGFWWLEWVERDEALLIFCWTSRQADTNPSCIPSGKAGNEVSNLLANLSATMRNILNTFLIVVVLYVSHCKGYCGRVGRGAECGTSRGSEGV